MPKLSQRMLDAGIDENRFKELWAITRQYRKCKRRAELARAGIVDRPERKSGAWRKPDPTGNAAMALAENPDAKRAALIERCVNAVAEPAVAGALLCYVSTGLAWEHMDPRPPMCRKTFYARAQDFYIALDRALG